MLFATPLALDHPGSGGTIKSAALLTYLERRHEVDVACFVRPGQTWTRERGRTLTVPLDRPRTPGRLAASYLHRVPLSIERNRSPELSSKIAGLLAEERHDVFVADHWLMAQYLPRTFGGRTFLHEHNAEHRLWRRQADATRPGPVRWAMRREAERIHRYEAEILRRFEVVFAVSEADRDALLALGAPPPVPILPNVPDPTLLHRPALEPVPEPVLLFFGTLSWRPNADGLAQFLDQGFPALRRELPDVRMVIAGQGAPASLTTRVGRTPGVEIVGDVHDDEPLYRAARCFVDVGIGGGGTRVKVLNAMARGLPVVATAHAADGLAVRPGEHLLLADDPASAPGPIVRLLRDDGLWTALSRAGRELVRDRYVPEVAFAAFDEALDLAT
ncbi:MAG TPA: glycosyltransferase family 4 protein [Actinomycetota bacterium]|nr:glycosyltransferase family 4 protein [Actinomycetota bacterium]